MSPLRGPLLPELPPGTRWIPIGHGASGDTVHRRSDGAAFAKTARGCSVAGLEEERRRTDWLADFDLGSPRVLDWIVRGDQACLVTSPIPGVPASSLRSPDLLRAWASIVRRLELLHELPVQECPFDRSLTTLFERAVDVVGRNAVDPAFLEDEHRDVPPVVLLHELRNELPLRQEQEAHDLVVCHGDACLPNILVDPRSLRCTGLVDLGRLGRADRYADLSLLLANARESWDGPTDGRTAFERTFQELRIEEPDEERLGFYLRLDPLTWG